MQTDQEFHAERDAREREILNNVRQLMRNGDAAPLITARLPFVNKTRSFRALPAFGLEKVARHASNRAHLTVSGTDWIDFYSRGQYGAFNTESLPARYLEMFLADLESIASYQGNVYVVTSYLTVIAWTRDVQHSGTLVMPRVDYSPTTTRHQLITLDAGAAWLETNGA